MQSRRIKNKVNGWLIIDKPEGITSSAVVNSLKKKFNAAKAGHAGTLDPDATGLLAVAFGEATKTIQFITNSPKSYSFSILFGASTDTDDSSGNIIQVSKNRPSNEQICRELENFQGFIQQVPPIVSAIKVNGERAYKLFRQGEDIKLKSREVYIEIIEMKSRISENEAEFEMTCGKGGYVRSVARDLGENLSCYAHVKNIRRIRSSTFNLSSALSWSNLLNLTEAQLLSLLLPTSTALMEVTQIPCTKSEMISLSNGNPVRLLSYSGHDIKTAWVSFERQPLALGRFEKKIFYPSRLFNFDI